MHTLIKGLAVSAIDLRSSMPEFTAVEVRPEGAGAKAAADPIKRRESFMVVLTRRGSIVGRCVFQASKLNMRWANLCDPPKFLRDGACFSQNSGENSGDSEFLGYSAYFCDSGICFCRNGFCHELEQTGTTFISFFINIGSSKLNLFCASFLITGC